MDTRQIDLGNRRQVRQFIELPFRLYKDTPQWVPPLESDARRMLDQTRHPFYRYGRAAFFLAFDSHSIPVGRIAVLENDHYNQFNGEKTAFFYLFECINDLEAAKQLFDCAFKWSQLHHLKKITGPKGFTVMDGMGLLVKGFEFRPAFGLPYNPPYYPQLVEGAGLIQAGDTVSGYLSSSAAFPEKIHRLSSLVQERRGLRIIRFKNRFQFSKYIPALQSLYNTALEGTTGNIPLTDKDVKTLADQLLWFADPRLIKIIMKGDELAGFLIAYPDISAAVQRCRGRLFPFGWLDLLIETKRTRWVNINGAAIIEKYRGLGGTAVLFSEMYKSIQAGRFEHAEIIQIGTENERMQLELHNLGIDFYKTHRLYQRELLIV